MELIIEEPDISQTIDDEQSIKKDAFIKVILQNIEPL